MARVVLLEDDDPDAYFVNEEAVGPNCANRRDDVLLVQFFLRLLSDRNNRYRPANAKDLLAITGIYNPETTAYTKAYVVEWNRLQAALSPLKDDGRVDSPLKTSDFSSPITRTTYVILRMNLEYQKGWSKTRLSSLNGFPKELRKNFYIK